MEHSRTGFWRRARNYKTELLGNCLWSNRKWSVSEKRGAATRGPFAVLRALTLRAAFFPQLSVQ